MNRQFLLVAVFAIACVNPSKAEDKPAAPQSPPPDQVVFVSSQVVKVSADVEVVFLTIEQVYWETRPDEKTKGTKWISKAVKKQLPLSKGVTITEIGGQKPLNKEDVAMRIKPGDPILISRDGKGLDPYYTSVYKPGTLVVAFPR